MSDNQTPKKADSSIVVALLGFLGVVVTAILTIYAPIIQDNLRQKNQPTPPGPIIITATFAPSLTPAPTSTTLPGEPTSTPVTPTETPIPSPTPAPVELGKDWAQSCISALWRPYPTNIPVIDGGNGCWKNPVHVFSATNGNLAFLAQRGSNGLAEFYGLFAPLPASGSVSIHVHLRDLSNTDLLLGVYAEPDLASQGLLMTIPSGNVKKRMIVQKDNINNYTTMQQTNSIDQGDGFWFTFTFNDLSASATVNPSVFVTNPISIPAPQKWLFIGYKGLNGTYRIEGNFFGLEVK